MTTPALAVAHLFAATKTTVTLAAAGKILAAPGGGGGPHLNTGGIRAWILANIVPLLLILLGIWVVANSKSAKFSKVASIGAIALIGIMFMVAPNSFVAFGRGLVNLAFG